VAKWIPESAIIAMHRELLAEHGGLAASIDRNKLGSTIARPQNLEAYTKSPPSLFELSAAYGYGFARNHCFTDGNKRIALASIDVFLIRNGLELVADEADAANIIEELAAGEISESELSKWIEANTQELLQS
jgi:death-on-curing protein